MAITSVAHMNTKPYSSLFCVWVQMPSYCKCDNEYPGICFLGTPWTCSVTPEGAHVSDWGEEIGIEFVIPPEAVPKGKQLELSVWPCVTTPFQFPEGYDAASPVYLITPSFEFSCNVTLKMYHFCATDTAEDCKSMTFLTSPATLHSREKKQQPQYQFKVLDKGVFNPGEEYGSVSLKHFCLSAVGVKRKKSSHSRAPSTKRQRGIICSVLVYVHRVMYMYIYIIHVGAI